MPIQIDKFETSVDVTPPAQPAMPRPEQAAQPAATSVPPSLRDAVMKVFADEFESFSRMRGH